MNRLPGILFCCGLMACSDSQVGTDEPLVAKQTMVTVVTPVQRNVQEVLTALGSVESISDPTVSAETSGQVRSIGVKEGDTVEAGMLLVGLDSTLHSIETAKAEAQLRRADVLLKNQNEEVKRLKRLNESQSVSRDKLEDEQAQQEILRAQRDVARKQWEQSVYLESKTRVKSPLAGLVARRHVSTGDFVSMGQPLFDLVSVGRLRARIAFPEQDASRIAIGKEVQLTTPAAPGVIALGEVTAINPRIKSHNRAVEVTVEFDNPGGWLPGASVDATLVVEQRNGALTIPLIAVVKRSGRDVIFKVVDGVAHEEHIRAGWVEDGWVEVQGFVVPTDFIVSEGAALISQGSVVTMAPGVETALAGGK